MKEKIFLAIIAPLIVAIVGGIVVVVIQRSVESQMPMLSIESQANGLKITNNTEQVLRVRVGYAVVDSQGRSYCYPEATASEEGQKDPKVLPKETRFFPPGKCGNNFDDYAIWAWNAEGSLVFTNGK